MLLFSMLPAIHMSTADWSPIHFTNSISLGRQVLSNHASVGL